MKQHKNTFLFIICYMAYTAIYIARLNLSMASPGMMEEGILNTAQVGALGSIFSVLYAAGRLLNGRLSDNKPPWIMICSGLVLAGISNLLIGLFPPFIGILLLWSINAYAQSMLWSSILCAVSNIYEPHVAKRKTSYMVTSVAAGNILGIVVNMLIITKIGLRFAFVIPGGMTLILSTLVFWTMRAIPAQKEDVVIQGSMISLFRNPEIRLTILPAMLHGVMKDNISLWMAVFFVDKFRIDLRASAYFVLLIPVIGFIGRLLYPLCYKLCREQEHKVSMYAFAACIAFSALLCFPAVSPIIAALCLALIYTAVSLINTSILSIFPINFLSAGQVASVSGIMDFATYLGAGISAAVYGFVITHFGYTPMFVSWAAISIVSLCLLGVLNRRQKQKMEAGEARSTNG